MPKVTENYFGTSREKGSFLASEVGLKLETRDMTAQAKSLGVDIVDACGATVKVIKAGKMYPANSASAQGIVFQDVYPDAEGHYIGSLMTGGYVYKERLEDSVSAAVEPLEKKGLYFKDYPAIVRPDFGTGDLIALAKPSGSFSGGTLTVEAVANAVGYAVYKNGNYVGQIAKGQTKLAVKGTSSDKITVVALADNVTYKNSPLSNEITWA